MNAAMIFELNLTDRAESVFVGALNARNTLIDQMIADGLLAVWQTIGTFGRLIEITPAGRDALMSANAAQIFSPTPLMVHHHEYLGHTVFVCKFSTYAHIEARLNEIDKRILREGYRFARESHADVHARCARHVGDDTKYYAQN